MKEDKIIPELFKKIVGRADPKERRIYQKIQEKASKHYVSSRIGTFLVAEEYRINFTKYLTDEDREELRKVKNLSQQVRDVPPKIIEKQITKSIESLKGITPIEPFLPSKLLDEAKEMAEKTYPYLYIFENSIRNVIKTLMEKTYGKDWWELRVERLHSTIDSEVKKRMNEEKENRWVSSKRGIHEIYYTDLDDLRIIIEDNWSIFKKIHNRRSWVIEHIMQLRYSRNIIAHNNPLGKRDVTSIQTKIHEWFDQIKDLKI